MGYGGVSQRVGSEDLGDAGGDGGSTLAIIPLTHSCLRRPESHIAVVTHSSFLDFTLKSFGEGFSTPVQGELQRWFENCEMRSLVVANIVEPLPDDRLHHRGGLNSGVGQR